MINIFIQSSVESLALSNFCYFMCIFLTLITVYLDVEFVSCIDLSQSSEILDGLKLNFFSI